MKIRTPWVPLLALAFSAIVQPVNAQGHIGFRWTGTHAVTCTLFKANDAEFRQQIKKWDANAGKTSNVEAEAGDYVIRIAAPGFEPLAVHVQNGKTAKIGPRVGQLAFQWNGPDLVVCDLFKADDTQLKQSLGSFNGLPGKLTTVDTAPGDYQLRIAAPGNTPIPITIRHGKTTKIER